MWNTDANGNYTSGATGLVSGTDPSLELLEPSFQQDLNKDGTIGLKATTVIESNGATSLWLVGTAYVVGATGPTLRYQNATVTAGQFGAIAPIAAEQTSTGYEVAWKVTGAEQYIVWNTDANGNYTSGATGLVSGTDPSLELLEPSFQQDLNGDGTIGLKLTHVIHASSTTILGIVGTTYVLQGNGANIATLQDQGVPVTVGEFDTWTPIGAAQVSTGYEVAWKHGTADEYVVWNTDFTGNFVSTPTNVVTGKDAALESLEPSFQQDLNGDGTIGIPSSSGAGVGGSATLYSPVAYLEDIARNPGGELPASSNTASASSGLSAPALSFIGTPEAVTLNPTGAEVVYTLQPYSGVDLITGFTYGIDILRIDMVGAANGILQAFDTSVGGVHAIALASGTDLAHGVVLLNMTGTGETAANLLASHTTFSLGRAYIS